MLDINDAIAQGMGRAVTVGALSTGIVGGGAGTILDQDQPELAIGVPGGYVIRPFYIGVQAQAGAITTDADETEALVAVDSLGLWLGDGTVTIENPSNLRTDLDKGSACRVGSAFTGNMTTTPGYAVAAAAAPVLDLELARAVQTVDLATGANQDLQIVQLTYKPKHPIFLVGPATLLVYFGGTVATVGGFVQARWVEGKTSDMLPAV